MRKLLFFSSMSLLSLICYGQTSRYMKQVKVNWETRLFEDSLPVDESFVLVVYSNSALPANFTLMRYVERNAFYYYDQPIRLIDNKSGVAISTVIKQSIKSTNSGGTISTETVKEYNGDPSITIPHVRRYSVSPLRANFYYCLLDQINYATGQATSTPSANGLNIQKDNGAISNTYLSYQDNANRKVTAIVGTSYFKAVTHNVRPYLGFRYHLLPNNKNMQARYYEEMHPQGAQQNLLSKLSLDLGISLASIEDEPNNQYNLFGKNNLLTGVGFRIGDGFFLSSGVLWYNKKDKSDASKPKGIIKAAWYISLSFDWDFSKSFDGLKKALGAG